MVKGRPLKENPILDKHFYLSDKLVDMFSSASRGGNQDALGSGEVSITMPPTVFSGLVFYENMSTDERTLLVDEINNAFASSLSQFSMEINTVEWKPKSLAAPEHFYEFLKKKTLLVNCVIFPNLRLFSFVERMIRARSKTNKRRIIWNHLANTWILLAIRKRYDKHAMWNDFCLTKKVYYFIRDNLDNSDDRDREKKYDKKKKPTSHEYCLTRGFHSC